MRAPAVSEETMCELCAYHGSNCCCTFNLASSIASTTYDGFNSSSNVRNAPWAGRKTYKSQQAVRPLSSCNQQRL